MINSQFEIQITDYLASKLKDICEVIPTEVTKNNGIVLKGIRFVRKDSVVQPTIYLEGYETLYEEGKTVEEIGEMIRKAYLRASEQEMPDLSFFYDYENVKDRIICKLINAAKNKKMLLDVPHIRFLDLAAVFYCRLDLSESETGTILIRNSHIENWKVPVERIYGDALSNNDRLLGSCMMPILSVLKDLASHMALKDQETADALADTDKEEQVPMYVLTNRQSVNGAACMLDSKVLKAFSEAHGGDFYILPSSVHELILVPGVTEDSTKGLKEIVKSVNKSEISKEDVLSDEVYIYDSKKNAVVFA